MEIRLRVLEESDLSQLKEWRNSDWLRPFVREHRLLNMVNQQEWFEAMSHDQTCAMFGIARDDRGPRWVVESLQIPDTDLAGVCGLTHISWVNRTAEVSIYVDPTHQHLGVGLKALRHLKAKAFQEFHLHRLWAEIFEFNTKSVELFERAGFIQEGVMEDHVFKNGAYHDSLIYGLVADDDGSY